MALLVMMLGVLLVWSVVTLRFGKITDALFHTVSQPTSAQGQ